MKLYTQTLWRRFFGLNVSQIEPLLFVGGQFQVGQWPLLHALGIRAVLSLQAEHEDQFSEPLPKRTLRLLVEDFTPPSLAQLREGVDFITNAHGEGLPVFVHCHAGVGRAPLTTAAYLMQQRKLNTVAALRVIRRARPIIRLNEIQLARLREWEGMMKYEG
ncbi:MAG: dual specificity protein phosphatase family protein [Chloroflexaceae bacterium]|jgi:protein-tyrosine phosphatase|nr:dual specificity protein phosphatase family protein [Chloroflexaceae bacterium]